MADEVDPALAQAQLFLNINRELTNLSQTLTTQGISTVVQKFDGQSRNFREWMKSIEKYATLVNVPDDRKKLIAYQSSSGAVSGFIHRYMLANPNQTWQHMKQQLAVRFSDVTDSQMALSLLRNCKQKTGESIHVFAERLLSLAEEAYNNQGGEAVERQLIDVFVDGLQNDHYKLKVLRDHPDTLQAAIGLCTNEQNLRARVNMSHSRSTLEPMEVDHSRGQRFRSNNRPNRFSRVNAVDNGSRRPVRCWHCGQEGHVIKECRVKQQGIRPAVGHGRGREREAKQPGTQEN